MHTTTQHAHMHTHKKPDKQRKTDTLPWFNSPITFHNLPAEFLPQWRCDQIYSGYSNSKTLLLEGQKKRDMRESKSH